MQKSFTSDYVIYIFNNSVQNIQAQTGDTGIPNFF